MRLDWRLYVYIIYNIILYIERILEYIIFYIENIEYTEYIYTIYIIYRFYTFYPDFNPLWPEFTLDYFPP